jgi:DNA-binding Lrp family transcriptional regulator
MEYLSKLFGSPARVKMLRYFLFNPETPVDRDGIVALARITPDTASKELATLARAGIITRRTFYRDVVRPGTTTPKRRKTLGYTLDAKYPHLPQLTRFLRDTLMVSEADIRNRLRNIGTVKLIVLAGFLINQERSGLDLLIVGDKLDESALRTAVRGLEAECGKEIRYAVLATEDYQYRKRVRDRLVREVMDFEHKEILNKLSAA